MDKPQFQCGYQGRSDYLWKGKRYEVRSSAEDWRPGVWNYTPEEYERQLVATVGTIMCYSPRDGFPPEDLEQFFPGYVRARFDTTTWVVEYAGGRKPETVHSRLYGTLSAVWAREMIAMNIDIKADEPAAV